MSIRNLDPASPSSLWLPPPRLLRRIGTALRRGRGAVIVAPAGYGKTALLRATLRISATPALWVGFADCQDEASLDRWLSEFGADPNSRVLLALDDFECVAQADDLAAYVDRMLRHIPASWRVLIASRVEPVSPELLRLIQYGELELLTEEDLALTVDETARLLSRAGPAMTRMDAEIQAITCGWPTGVKIASTLLEEGSRALSPRIVNASRSYFAHSVLGALEKDLREFLLASSVLPWLDAALCNQVLHRTDSSHRLAQLQERHLFLRQLDESSARLAFQPLFRSFLYSELQRHEPSTAVRALHRHAARVLATYGWIEEAASQLLVATDWSGLGGLIRRHFGFLFIADRPRTVLSWLDQVPERVVSTSPWLLVGRARAERQLGINKRGSEDAGRARHLFAQSHDRYGEAAALLEEANRAEQNGELALAERHCRAALQNVHESALCVDVYCTLAQVLAHLGHLDDAAQAAQQALEKLPGVQRSDVARMQRTLALAQLGLVQALEGDVIGARRRLDQACAAADPERPDSGSMMARYLRAFVAGRSGDFDGAFADLAVSQSTAERLERADHVALCRGLRGELLSVLGKITAAEAELRSAGWPCNHWVDAGFFYYASGQFQQAAQIYESDVARGAVTGDFLDQARAAAMLGACLVAMDHPREGWQLLEQAESVHAASPVASRLPGIRLHLSDLAFSQGNAEAGGRWLRQALSGARAGGTLVFFAFSPLVVARSLRRARTMGLELDFVQKCEHLLQPLHAAAFTAVAAEAGQATELLARCADTRIRNDFEGWLAAGVLTSDGLARLLKEFDLTWREAQVFVRYYLPAADASDGSSRRRTDVARQLGIAEHTIRHHVSSIRDKLGLGGQRALGAYQWALAQHITAGA